MASPNNKSLRSRMGSLLRRKSSTRLSIPPTSPSPPPRPASDRSSSERRVSSQAEETSSNPAPPPHAPVAASVPSPIAESPDREAAATLHEPFVVPPDVQGTVATTTSPSAPLIDPAGTLTDEPTQMATADEAGPASTQIESAPDPFPEPVHEALPALTEEPKSEPVVDTHIADSLEHADDHAEEPSAPAPPVPEPPPDATATSVAVVTQTESEQLSVAASAIGDTTLKHEEVVDSAGDNVAADATESAFSAEQTGHVSEPVSEPAVQPPANPLQNPWRINEGSAFFEASADLPTVSNVFSSAPYEDPFADPVMASNDVNGSFTVNMPVPLETHAAPVVDAPRDIIPSPFDDVAMPIPRIPPSPDDNDYVMVSGENELSALFSLPLLSAPADPTYSAVTISRTLSPMSQHWIRYVIPDPLSTAYYVHPARVVTTDVDVNDQRRLAAVEQFLEKQYHQRDGLEMWLTAGSTTDTFVMNWVDHHRRRCYSAQENTDDVNAEIRFWKFLDAHPIHAALPPNAQREALEAVMWTWSESLLVSERRRVTAPFTRDECQDLVRLLRETPEASSADTFLHARLVSRVMLRIARWRKARIASGLPGGTPYSGITDLLLSVSSALCLGIPYIMVMNERARIRLDEEAGLRFTLGTLPGVLMSVCTGIAAAIVLSASVTLLCLPGLDNVSRTAGFVALLLASFSIAAAAIASLRVRPEIVVSFGGEGLVVLSGRHFAQSLPLVLLIYSLLALVLAITLYSFFGTSYEPTQVVQQRFKAYTHWTVAGTFGGLLGVTAILCSLL
ncbi:hypothetical protein FISHEDRAFT_72936 [Fistulina hepatica ATCC 64428]|uniref:Uncharacterized protein n=1 Tax=Fistulina hepatica ATCC 64428 TaxID=1128425 RepID=A0A0D7ADR6_9AGAR|nr:hypothetical protein FISHEDRAFT_72936 [Fistulina hepatica ATCC 64428]